MFRLVWSNRNIILQPEDNVEVNVPIGVWSNRND